MPAQGVPIRDPEFTDFWNSMGYPVKPFVLVNEHVPGKDKVVCLAVKDVGVIHILSADEKHWLDRGIMAASVLLAFAKWFHSQPPST